MNDFPNPLEFLDFECICSYQHITHISWKTRTGDIYRTDELSLVVFEWYHARAYPNGFEEGRYERF